MTWIELLPLLGIGGIIGGIVGAYFQFKFQHQTQLKEFEYKEKRKRYFCINMLLLTKLDKNGLAKIKKHRPEMTTIEKLDDEIETELLNSYLFASNDVIKALIKFKNDASYDNYYQATNAMRKDLWGKKMIFEKELHITRN
jgi:hypothetical protein